MLLYTVGLLDAILSCSLYLLAISVSGHCVPWVVLCFFSFNAHVSYINKRKRSFTKNVMTMEN